MPLVWADKDSFLQLLPIDRNAKASSTARLRKAFVSLRGRAYRYAAQPDLRSAVGCQMSQSMMPFESALSTSVERSLYV